MESKYRVYFKDKYHLYLPRQQMVSRKSLNHIGTKTMYTIYFAWCFKKDISLNKNLSPRYINANHCFLLLMK